MPPATQPADPTLKAAAWAAFDPDVVSAKPTPPSASASPTPTRTPPVTLLSRDRPELGHSPNRFFDEAWHRRAYPDVAAALGRGAAASGFDLYCRGGFRSYSPHWLFDERLYRRRYPDLDRRGPRSGRHGQRLRPLPAPRRAGNADRPPVLRPGALPRPAGRGRGARGRGSRPVPPLPDAGSPPGRMGAHHALFRSRRGTWRNIRV